MYAFSSASSGAPQLNGLPGSLVAILNYCLVTGMGWTSPYTATNQAAYRQPAGSNGFYLNVDDSIGQNARICGFETMSAILTGANQFPSVGATSAGGGYFYKSVTADTVSRPWNFWSNGKCFHFYYGSSGTVSGSTLNPGQGIIFTFGDFPSFKAGDAFNTYIITENGASQNAAYAPVHYSMSANFQTGHTSYSSVVRPNTQIGTAIEPSRWVDIPGGSSPNYLGTGNIPYPAPIDGGINISKVYLGDTNAGRRGVIPGFWSWQHNSFLNCYDTFNGAGALAGRTFIVLYQNVGHYIIETSDTWSL